MGTPRGEYRRFTNEERLEIVKLVRDKADVRRVAKAKAINETTLENWYMRLKAFGEEDFVDAKPVTGAAWATAKTAELEKRVARIEKDLGIEA